MISDLVAMYDKGAITAHHLAVECLYLLDTAEPDGVLAQMPTDVLKAILDFADHFDPKEMTTNYGVIPTQDQVISASEWIRSQNGRESKSGPFILLGDR